MMSKILSKSLPEVSGVSQKLTALDVIESWRLPYHLSWVVKYIFRKNDISKSLKKMEWHLCCELTSSWRRQYDSRETPIFLLERVSRDWGLSIHMRAILSYVKAYGLMPSEKENLIQAIQHLQEEIQLYEKNGREQENVPV